MNLKFTLRILSFVVVAGLLVSCGGDRRSSLREGVQLYGEYETEDTSRDSFEEEEPYPDGAYEATVYYHNSSTGYSATYTLEVEVEGNEVTVIYFPNDGWLDDDHIWPDELDEDGYVLIEGEDGKSYEVQIN
jgi:hypothetical protein